MEKVYSYPSITTYSIKSAKIICGSNGKGAGQGSGNGNNGEYNEDLGAKSVGGIDWDQFDDEEEK